MSARIVVYGDMIDLADELEEEFHDKVLKVVDRAADLLLAETRRLLSLRQGTVRTSAPDGQPPERDTGALAASYRKIPGRIRGRVASAGIRSRDPAANRVEYGATDTRGIRTFPHPAVRLAIAGTAIGRATLAREAFGA